MDSGTGVTGEPTILPGGFVCLLGGVTLPLPLSVLWYGTSRLRHLCRHLLIVEAFREEGIRIPFPQREVHPFPEGARHMQGGES